MILDSIDISDHGQDDLCSEVQTQNNRAVEVMFLVVFVCLCLHVLRKYMENGTCENLGLSVSSIHDPEYS